VREEISKESEEKRISGEAYDTNKQTIYIVPKIQNRIKGTLCPGARRGILSDICAYGFGLASIPILVFSLDKRKHITNAGFCLNQRSNISDFIEQSDWFGHW